jgi:rhodanese-related sulfurtransferase
MLPAIRRPKFRILAPRLSTAVEKLVARARGKLVRLTPEQAATEQTSGALLIDTRPSEQRCRDGEVPGAVVVDRNVLEWRLDPASAHRIPEATDHAIRVIVICNEGFSSSLAAASLKELGLVNATDVIGGFQAWKAAGLPVAG